MEKSFPFDSVDGDRPVLAKDHAEYFGSVLSNGVIHTDRTPGLKATKGEGLNSILGVGKAIINGHLYVNPEEITFTHDAANNTNPRIDRIILRLDHNVESRHIRAFLVKGTPATNPQPPALTRTNAIYELSLAQVRINANSSTINMVTDERLLPEVCGIVNSLITSPIIYTSETEPEDMAPGSIWFRVVP